MFFENHGESRVQVGFGEGLSRLTATRGAHWGVVTKIIREAEALSGEKTRNQEIINRLELIHISLDEKLKVIADLAKQITDLIAFADIEKEVEETSEVRNKIFAAKNQVSRSLEIRYRVSCRTVSPDRPTSSQGQSHQAKLPKLTLE